MAQGPEFWCSIKLGPPLDPCSFCAAPTPYSRKVKGKPLTCRKCAKAGLGSGEGQS